MSGDLFGRARAEPGTPAHAAGERVIREARAYDEFEPRPGEREATIDEQIADVEREIRLRRRFYPGWVRNGTMTDATAARQMQAMLSVRRTLVRVRDQARAVMAALDALAPASGIGRVAAPCAVALSHAIEAMEDCTLSRDALDAMVWRALGWQVHRQKMGRLRKPEWAVRSPLSASWQRMAHPTRNVEAAALVVPWTWSWGVGVKRGHPHGWTALRLPMEEGVPFFECGGLTPALALLKAALFAQRWQAMERGAVA